MTEEINTSIDKQGGDGLGFEPGGMSGKWGYFKTETETQHKENLLIVDPETESVYLTKRETPALTLNKNQEDRSLFLYDLPQKEEFPKTIDQDLKENLYSEGPILISPGDSKSTSHTEFTFSNIKESELPENIKKVPLETAYSLIQKGQMGMETASAILTYRAKYYLSIIKNTKYPERYNPKFQYIDTNIDLPQTSQEQSKLEITETMKAGATCFTNVGYVTVKQKDGSLKKFYTAERTQDATVALITQDDSKETKIITVEQIRPPIGTSPIKELPGGVINEADGPALKAATRESVEEAGVIVDEDTISLLLRLPLGEYLSSKGFGKREIITIFAMKGEGAQEDSIHGVEEENEETKVHLTPISQIQENIKNGQISDLRTICAFYAYIGNEAKQELENKGFDLKIKRSS